MVGEEYFELRTKRLRLRPLVLEDWPADSGLAGIHRWRRCWPRPARPGLGRQCRLGSPSGGIAARRAFVRRL
jgi:hypothetical protein